MGARLLITSEVVAALGGPAQTRATLADVKISTYRCTICGQRGWLVEEPAAVVIRRTGNGAGQTKLVINFAHPACSGAQVIDTIDVGLPADVPMRAFGLVTDHDPRAVLVVSANVAESWRTENGDTIDALIATALHDGFAPVSDLTTAVPKIAGLTAYGTPDALLVIDRDGYEPYRGPSVGGPEWTAIAERQRQITVLIASGLRMADPGRDPVADLFTAFGRGMVAGGIARYRTGGPRPRQPWRSGRNRRRNTRR
ncbi:hypothetical protein [Paractinoplanes rishiriensis]|nr:hypothetical protein [Actinoplanes rishiriensis]